MREKFPSAILILIITTWTVLSYFHFTAPKEKEKPAESKKTSIIITENVNYTRQVHENIAKIKALAFYERPPLTARPFVRKNGNYRIAPLYNISTCMVEKTMSTMLQGIFCYLYDTDGWKNNNRSILTEPWEGRFCDMRNEMLTTAQRHFFMPQPHNTIVVTRDPFERFLSGFIDKCVNEKNECFQCGEDILCTVERLYYDVMAIGEANYDVRKARKYMLELGYETSHMCPQTWYCDLWDEAENYHFIRHGETTQSLEVMTNEIMEFLKQHSVEEGKLQYIEDALNTPTNHSTKASDIRKEYSDKLSQSQRHMEFFMNIYYYDYVAYGYTLPFDPYKVV